ncbi:MAG: two-component system response regulator, partial [Oscillospiraceae bacterium]|nr:two-component system response regulator [Oscillospiraceae bacterium]
GLDIPIQGRIMAIVDVYDAMVSERPYKRPYSHGETERAIMENAGSQFDPTIAQVFYEVRDRFKEIGAM